MSKMTLSLSGTDRQKIEAAKPDPDPDADCQYDPMRSMLVWTDDRPPDLSADGRFFIKLLSCARKFIHDGDVRLENHRNFRELWDWAKANGLRWNGFAHIELTAEERAYYDECRADPDPLRA
jgi:hypothetical protein